MSFLFSSLLSLLLAAALQQSSCEGDVPLDKEFKLRFGRTASVGPGLKVEFNSLVEDSRCPKGVNCVWEGNAKVGLKVSGAGKEAASLELNTNVEPRKGSLHGYEISLVRLEPYPKADARADKKEYVATLSVSRK